MIRKVPGYRAGFFGKLIGGVFLFEAGLLAVSYLSWQRLNNSRDTRKKAALRFPWALETYYWVGEKIDKDYPIRSADQLAWSTNPGKNIKRSDIPN